MRYEPQWKYTDAVEEKDTGNQKVKVLCLLSLLELGGDNGNFNFMTDSFKIRKICEFLELSNS